MLIWFGLIAIAYYVALFGWCYFHRSHHPTEKEEAPLPPTSKAGSVIGASTYTKRKEAQTSARTDTAVGNENQVEGNTPIFVEPIQEIPSVIPVEELNQAFTNTPLTAEEEAELEGEQPEEEAEEEEVDWAAEEEELSQYRAAGEEKMHYASGISFEELGRLNTLLQKEAVNEEEGVEAGDVLQKIAGTTLWDSLLSALPDSLKRVSEQIDYQLQRSKSDKEPIPEWMNFDIKNFT